MAARFTSKAPPPSLWLVCISTAAATLHLRATTRSLNRTRATADKRVPRANSGPGTESLPAQNRWQSDGMRGADPHTLHVHGSRSHRCSDRDNDFGDADSGVAIVKDDPITVFRW